MISIPVSLSDVVVARGGSSIVVYSEHDKLYSVEGGGLIKHLNDEFLPTIR